MRTAPSWSPRILWSLLVLRNRVRSTGYRVHPSPIIRGVHRESRRICLLTQIHAPLRACQETYRVSSSEEPNQVAHPTLVIAHDHVYLRALAAPFPSNEVNQGVLFEISVLTYRGSKNRADP